MLRWATLTAGSKSVFGMGPQESTAVINLVHNLPMEFRQILGNAVAEFGIGRPAIRVGFQPDLISDGWSLNMRNSGDSVIRTCKRLVADFKQAPPGLHKSATAPDVAKMARKLEADLVIAELAAKLPGAAFDSEKPGVVALFEKRVFDDYLYSLTEECPAQIDLTKVSEISAII